jgi:amino acid transporter
MKRHALDPVSLVFGTGFALTALVSMGGWTDASRLRLEWAWPVAAIVLGALIIALAVRGASERGSGNDGPVDARAAVRQSERPTSPPP